MALGNSRWNSDALGVDEKVRLVVDGQEIQIGEQYEAKIGFLTVPSSFALRLGHDAVVKDLVRDFAPNADFKLYIGDALQMSGKTDSLTVPADSGGTIVNLEGRDALAVVHDSYIEEEKQYTDATYFDFVKSNLADMNLDGLSADGAASRKIQTGIRALAASVEPGAKLKIANDAGVEGAVVRIVRSKIGERRYEFIKKHLDRAGLFLRAAPDGTFVLSSPAGNQKPLYRILRRRTRNALNEVSVQLHEFRNSAAPPRYSACVIYARHGGRKYARAIVSSGDVDDEMSNPRQKNANGEFSGFGIPNRLLVLRDQNVYSKEQASALARRKLAEGRRASWRLSYVATGHTAPALIGGGRAVWAPDTVVHVLDEQLGYDEPMWIESVVHRRVPHTETVINLMRTKDLLFGADDEE